MPPEVEKTSGLKLPCSMLRGIGRDVAFFFESYTTETALASCFSVHYHTLIHAMVPPVNVIDWSQGLFQVIQKTFLPTNTRLVLQPAPLHWIILRILSNCSEAAQSVNFSNPQSKIVAKVTDNSHVKVISTVATLPTVSKVICFFCFFFSRARWTALAYHPQH